MNRFAFKQQSQPLASEPIKKRQNPEAIGVPVMFYNTIRDSFICSVLDTNPFNPLNTNRDPPSLEIGIKDKKYRVVLYYQEFIKAWVKYVIDIPIFSELVQLNRKSKKKSGNSTYETNEVVRSKVLSLPSTTKIREYSINEEQVLVLESVKRAMIVYLKCDDSLAKKNSCDLWTVNQLGDQRGAQYSNVATASNITKASRLSNIGFQAFSTDPDTRAKCEEFYKAEKRRISNIGSKSTKISDSIVRNLSGKEAEIHNEMAIKNLLESIGTDVQSEEDDSISTKVSEGNVVNLAAIKTHNVTKDSKVPKSSALSLAKRYKNMQSEYHKLTGYPLDLETEKANNTYDYRTYELEWARNLLSTNPGVRFWYNVFRDRMEADEVVSTSVVPRKQISDVSVAQNRSVVSKDSNSTEDLIENRVSRPQITQQPNNARDNNMLYNDTKPNSRQLSSYTVQNTMRSKPPPKLEQQNRPSVSDNLQYRPSGGANTISSRLTGFMSNVLGDSKDIKDVKDSSAYISTADSKDNAGTPHIPDDLFDSYIPGKDQEEEELPTD